MRPHSAWSRTLYPNLYVWYIFASSLDVMMTYLIIWGLAGHEANAIAAALVKRFGHWGLVGLKFASVVLVVGVCEVVGRRDTKSGRNLAITAIVLSALPVGVGIVHIIRWLNWDIGQVIHQWESTPEP